MYGNVYMGVTRNRMLCRNLFLKLLGHDTTEVLVRLVGISELKTLLPDFLGPVDCRP